MTQSQSVSQLLRKSTSTIFAAIIAMGLLAGGSSTMAATNLYWVGGSGLFSTASNWDPAQAPATDDTTIFTNDASYAVSFSGPSPVMDSSIFNNHSGALTINLSGNTWTVTNIFRIAGEGSTSTVYLASGTLDVEAVVPPASGAVRIGDGTNGVGELYVTNGILAYNSVMLGGNAISRGKLVIAGPGVGTSSFSATAGTLSIGGSGSALNCS
jgi:hypothetical protein